MVFLLKSLMSVKEEVSLKQYNTFGIEAIAKRFSKFSSLEDLTQILAQKGNDELLVLGGGSNILLTKDFNGLVILNEIKGFDIVSKTHHRGFIKKNYEAIYW